MSSLNVIRCCLTGTVAAIALTACDTTQKPEISMSVGKPQSITFGNSVSAITATLQPICESMEIRPINPPSMPAVDTQTQIDCHGFGYFGALRQAEFVFVNDKLMLTWILVEADEIPSLEVAFSNQFGEPTSSKDTILAYANNFAGVRNDPPEALYYSETAAPFVMDRVHKLPDRD